MKIEGAEVTLTKSAQGEKIIVSLNVNHTVDSAEPDDGTGEVREENISTRHLAEVSVEYKKEKNRLKEKN